MNIFGTLFITLNLLLWNAITSQAWSSESTNSQKEIIQQQIRIGISNRKQPYTYISEEQEYSGILIDETKRLCSIAEIGCEFTANDFHQLLEDLQAFKVNAFIVVDSMVLSEIDQVVLSKPLCTATPVFIQKNTQQTKTEKADFQRSTIGVLEASLHHFYLLDEYNHLARVKSYDLLESGVLDLFFGRIDSLFTDEAFYEARIRGTSLGDTDQTGQLVPVKVGQPELSPTAMRLVFRQNDAELLAVFDKNIPTSPPLCVDLVKKTEEDAVPSASETENK